MGQARELAAQVAWRLKPQSALGIGDLRMGDGKYVMSSDGSKSRGIAFFRVGVPDVADESRMDYSAALKTALQQQRMKGLFEGLRRAGLPFAYVMLMSEAESDGAAAPLLEFDLVVGTWVDCKKKEDPGAILEQRASILAAAVSVALPNARVERLVRKELAGFVRSMLLPGGRPALQKASAAAAGALCTFEEMSPLSGDLNGAPDFYVPNASESGADGPLLGAVRSGGREYHDFRLQLDDLRRHVSVLGMTGSGKSTTAAAIVSQAAEAGLPVMILDWHNEFADAVSEAGGKVVAPGKDDLAVNPLEVGPGADPAEHIAMVSDIFSDIYHFTHPQAYMFRNALQKRLSETSVDEVPTIASLVKTIESYPLRSAYDNETKVALLRRLVPLTQGQSGKALGGAGPLRLEELLSTSVCVELGHMRDVQSRAVFCDIILKMIYEEKVGRKGSLDHLTVIEEARNIAPARRAEDPPSVGERMISELRKFGEAMMFVAQFPTQVAAEVVKNSGTKIVHRLAWPDDVSLIGDSLGLNQMQREHLTRLKVGEAVVGLTRIQKPVLVQVRPGYSQTMETSDPSVGPER
ncbi:MAG: ATP-binding protein [Nitrososphaerota archaeon]|nr:ATP-binding protein [Nitrososphaerota archaeon]MDG6974177.1 ATP-binding protein [Nitrososphaerota archaeon]MDG6975211.1 ATP-binding protein [Nitrososphaerota archaeon]